VSEQPAAGSSALTLAALRQARASREALLRRILPVGLGALVIVVVTTSRAKPGAGLHGASLGLTLALAGFGLAALAGFVALVVRRTAGRLSVTRTGTDSRPGSIARVKTSASLGNDQESDTDRGSGLVVAVDGPSGAGKSSTSRGVATALGLRYLDTGAMYRALTWWLLDRGADLTDPGVVAGLVTAPHIEVSTDPRAPWTRVDGTDVSEAIRTREVTAAVSAVAAVPQVRAHLIAKQREIIASVPGIVAEGRDIGTVVAPGADIKVFLTADGAARASRRSAEASWSTQADQDRRDRLDAAQSGKAADAVVVDSTGLSLDEVVGIIVGLALHKSR
jgi:cytidylate kinase